MFAPVVREPEDDGPCSISVDDVELELAGGPAGDSAGVTVEPMTTSKSIAWSKYM